MEILVDVPDSSASIQATVRDETGKPPPLPLPLHSLPVRTGQEDILVRSTTLDGEMRCQITASGCGTRICSIVRFVHISWVR